MLDTRETILSLARAMVQAHGYQGLSFRDLAKAVGIKSASIHYHFPTKADLVAALARRYGEDAQATLAEIAGEERDAGACLSRYVAVFRRALENENRLCLCGFLAAEYDDLPDMVKREVRTFGDINVAWLTEMLRRADPAGEKRATEQRAFAIFAAIGGAQLAARSRGDIALFDRIVESYRATGLIPA